MHLGGSDNLSNILGWVSIASWIVVYSPQIYENFALQSGEGLSVIFVVVWLLGDVCNLAGAVIAGLLPTVIILAIYYSICDIILLSQIYFYRWKRNNRNFLSSTEHDPLIINITQDQLNTTSTKLLFVRYTVALLFISTVGTAAWYVGNGVHQYTEPESALRWDIQILGWTSAALYLGARIPQILKNMKTQCEGLSPALFFFAIFGNVTYAMSICIKSTDTNYLISNASWLAGSVLTVFLDVTVLCQFFYYRSAGRERTCPTSET